MLRSRKILFVMIMICVLIVSSVPVYAAGTSDGSAGQTYVFSYWNIDTLVARTNDGRELIFEFPSDFFYRSDVTEESVFLRSKDGIHDIHLRFYGIELDGVRYMNVDINFDLETATLVSLDFTFLNSVVYPNNSLSPSVVIQPINRRTPLFWLWNSANAEGITDDAVFDITSSWSCVLPNPRADGSVGFDTVTGQMSELYEHDVDGQTFFELLMPQYQLDSKVDTFRKRGYSDIGTALYYDVCKSTILLDYYDVLNSTFTLLLPVGACDSSAGYIVGATRVSYWYDMYGNFSPFPSYPDTDIDYGLNEITDFFAEIVGGVFSMQIFPGIFIGGIVFAIFGIKFVKVAINFFAGG